MAETTLGAYLEEWIEVQRSHLQPTTVHSYRGAIDRYLLPHLGDTPLDGLTIPQLNGFYATLLREGGHNGKRLSVRTVRYAHAVLHKALSDAVRDRVLEHNVASHATPPTRDPEADEEPKEPTVWTAPQLKRFLELTADDWLRPLWVLAATTGMRRGELLGLRCQDVDLDDRTIHVRRALASVDGRLIHKAPKTNRPRSLKIDEMTVRTLEERFAERDRDRFDFGHGWKDQWDLVFTTHDGLPLNPLTITVRFRRLVLPLPLPTLRLHDLRHTHATLLLQAGVPVKVVSTRLGHADIQMTLQIYAHVLPAMDEDAADAFSEHVDLNGALGGTHADDEEEDR